MYFNIRVEDRILFSKSSLTHDQRNKTPAGGFVLLFLVADVVLRILKERYGFFLKFLNWSLASTCECRGLTYTCTMAGFDMSSPFLGVFPCSI